MNTTRLNQRNLRRRGGSLLEAAWVFPLLLLFIIFPSLEFGYLFYLKHTLAGAAREGAREAIVSGSDNTKVNTAIARVLKQAGLQVSDTTVDSTKFTLVLDPTNVATTTTGNPQKVTISTTWDKVGLKPSLMIPNTKVIEGITVMRKEG